MLVDLLQTLSERASAHGVGFLLIGGHALNLMGLSRQTVDVDILVSRNQKETWRRIIERLGYRVFHEHFAFLQFSPPSIMDWPLDVMITDAETHEKLMSRAWTTRLGDVTVFIPCLEHMLALKFHALKQEQPERERKDLVDILDLLDHHGMAIEDPVFQKLCERYGNQEIYETLKAWRT